VVLHFKGVRGFRGGKPNIISLGKLNFIFETAFFIIGMKTEKHPKAVNIISKASLWDGNRQLPGTLSLTPKNLIFQFDDFQKSHLNLVIPLEDIETAEHFLVFELARNGLKISTEKGYDLFVLENAMDFRKVLMKAIGKLGS
jgi:hypothetical protein